jgi:hypothetical protein
MKPSRRKTANRLLWVLGGLMLADVIFLSYFWVFRAAYYFPDRYEEAYRATAVGGGCGLLFVFAFPLLWSFRSGAGPRGQDTAHHPDPAQ